MCFRLLAGVRPPPLLHQEAGNSGQREDMTQLLVELGTESGLDVRVASSPTSEFVEIAWGDCACSLYTRREGRQRVIAFIDALLARELRVQLLLYQDGEAFDWTRPSVERVPLGAFRREALRALPEGRVTELVEG